MAIHATVEDGAVYAGGKGALAPSSVVLRVTLHNIEQRWVHVQKQVEQQWAMLLADEELGELGVSVDPCELFVEPMPNAMSYAHWVTALCVAFQRWAGDPVWKGQVLEIEGDMAKLALPVVRAEVIDGAFQLAVRHVLIHCEPDNEREDKATVLAQDLRAWLEKMQERGYSPGFMGLALAARKRQIPVKVRGGFAQLGWGSQQERIDTTFTGKTSNMASKIARDKTLTKQLLDESGIPVPQGGVAHTLEQAVNLSGKLGWPVVLKPYNQDGGVAVTAGVRDLEELRTAFTTASQASGGGVIVEKHIEGHDYRILVMNGEMLSVIHRVPGGVVGDGCKTVEQLLKWVNKDPRRGRKKHSALIALDMDAEARACLQQQGLSVQSVPAQGAHVYLRRTANISTGGTAFDVTHQIHPDNQHLAERVARLIGLDIAGIDFISQDIGRSWRENGAVICEVNAQPGLRVHRRGAPDQDIYGDIVERLSLKQTLRIPTVAITGTNGKTTVSRMVHHLWQQAGQCAGVTTTQGVWIGDEQITDRNLSGYPGATVVLDDPAVDVAVMELPRKGLIRFGHPCDRYDAAALLNVQNDHIGVDGIDSLQAMAELKAQVLERASKAIVVNAQDPLTLAMAARSGAPRCLLVSEDDQVAAVQAHLRQGAEAVVIQRLDGQPWVVHLQGEKQTRIMALHDIPAVMNGVLSFNVMNALFAVALVWSQGMAPSVIDRGMSSFANDVAHNLGRCNCIEGFPYQLILDYGHNPDGFKILCEIVEKWPTQGVKRLVSLKMGSRHAHHFALTANLVARHFDHVVLGCDPGYVHANAEYAGEDPVQNMLQTGKMQWLQAGLSEEALLTHADPARALQMALELAQPGDLVLVLAEPALALPVIEAQRKQWANQSGALA